ncbi:MAG TPA: NFACT family protein [Longimicrobiales bacterium]|nr:NFACT family protein [Longimicrobiales bacterium]
MSNAIRYDALLVRDLARELDRTLRRVRLDAVVLDRDTLRLTLHVRPRRRSGATPDSLLWQLHPESGHLARVAPERVKGGVQLGAVTTITGVHAPPDERILIIDLDAHDAPDGAARRIVIELVTNQWNALTLGADGRITGVLRERETRGRVLRAGAAYELPARSSRAGAAAPLDRTQWHDALGIVPPGERLRALLRFAAYTSPLNAAAILAGADVSGDEAVLDQALARYLDMIWTGERTPALLHLDDRWQPYSRIDPDRESAEPLDSLVEAFHLAAERSAATPAETGEVDRALEALSRRIEVLDRRAERLREEQAGAGSEAARLRAQADLLLAQLYRVERGSDRVTLDDFAGGTVEVGLDPTQSAAENASRLYEHARKRDRASARIPGLLASAAQERQRAERLVERVRAGECTPDELAKVLAQPRATSRRDGPSLPYREYRTTGGLEVRVGRGSRANDELTFHHSRPTDVWLHARDVAGAHVILRWERADENPPASAIAEAGVLAALFSRARTSGTVAVDWTRRKYVRKPRKAAPGLVLPDRVRTIFVEPDPSAEERMRAEV